MTAKDTKKILLFDNFLSSLAKEPLGIKYKYIARILFISESTLSKLRHQKLNKIPESLVPDNIGDNFAKGIMNFFTYSENTVKRFSVYAQRMIDSFICSDLLYKFAKNISNIEKTTNKSNTNNIKEIYNQIIPRFLKRCYEEAYSNSAFNYSKITSNKNNIQNDILFKKVCDIINRDSFDSDRMLELLNIVYAANIRHQISKYMLGSRSFIDMTSKYFENQSHEPFFNYVHQNEVISISSDFSRITRSVKGKQQIVFQSVKPQKYVLLHPFNHLVNMPTNEIINKSFTKMECTINHVPIVDYINMHENTNYTNIAQILSANQIKDNISGTIETQLTFRFNLYPNEVGETADIVYEYSYVTPFIPNISCNYFFSLLYPCKFLEHEIALDAKTKAKWGVDIQLFTPVTTSVCTSESSDNVVAQSAGTSDLKRVTFYDWALPGTGYCRNIYELKYKDEQ